VPEAYGIDYVTMPGYLPLPPGRSRQGRRRPPRVVSGVLLAGQYAPGDPYAVWAGAPPSAVVGGGLLVFTVPDPGPR